MRWILALFSMIALAPAAMAETVGMAKPWQLDFQPAATPVMEQFAWLHDFLLVIITVIVVFVLALLVYVCVRFRASKNPVPSKTTHNVALEIVWVAIPVLILVAIAVPSLRTHFQYVHGLGYNEELGETDLTLKVTGYQWYWNYEYPDAEIKFDSYMKQEEDLLDGAADLGDEALLRRL